MVEGIFELVEAPVAGAGFGARLVEGVASAKLVARRFQRACCIRCSGYARTRIEGGRYPVALMQQPGQLENGSIAERNLKHGSHRFARNPMLGLASSPSRVRCAAQKRRALDRCGRATRSPGYVRNGSCAT
jgi:hypothetical protein